MFLNNPTLPSNKISYSEVHTTELHIACKNNYKLYDNDTTNWQADYQVCIPQRIWRKVMWSSAALKSEAVSWYLLRSHKGLVLSSLCVLRADHLLGIHTGGVPGYLFLNELWTSETTMSFKFLVFQFLPWEIEMKLIFTAEMLKVPSVSNRDYFIVTFPAVLFSFRWIILFLFVYNFPSHIYHRYLSDIWNTKFWAA